MLRCRAIHGLAVNGGDDQSQGAVAVKAGGGDDEAGDEEQGNEFFG